MGCAPLLGDCQVCHPPGPPERFRFASLQSTAGQRLLDDHRCGDPPLASMLLLVDGCCYRKSRAVLEICRRLRAPWSLLYLLIVAPRAISDRLYDFVGARRYRWFGKRKVCWAPSEELRARFLN
jgi:predicted DCC family thiol-disulfide oxidoreductase YuxK